jgi:hypothetical protein
MTKKSKTSKPNDKAASEQEVVIHGPTLHMRAATDKAFNRREFLADASSLETSFVLATVASSYKGQFVTGFNAMVLCDSSRVICIEFPLGTPQARNASVYKIGVLLGTMQKFREALLFEATAIENAREEAAQ